MEPSKYLVNEKNDIYENLQLEEDMENFMRYKLMGGKVFLKNHVVPHRFECQKDRKRPGDMTEQPSAVKQARKNLVATLLTSSLDSFPCSQAESSKVAERSKTDTQLESTSNENSSTVVELTPKPLECLIVSEKVSCERVSSCCKLTQTEWTGANATVCRTVSTHFRPKYRSKFVQTDVCLATKVPFLLDK